ncbi:hypothetical protein BDW59DRAFT_167223 [Aspergillus cavernicola]|uniref:Major facilitator superfamily (MFS) profile domain-containing protein n=1 Tax=Aspergillus cavernicola TaxID=176166 RepID=A0ABR4HFU5_9EURO
MAFSTLGLPFSIESSWYLVRRNDLDGARRALQRLYGPEVDIEIKLAAIRMATQNEANHTKKHQMGRLRVTACGVLGNILSWFLINLYGRRRLFLLGMTAMSGLNILIGILDVVPANAAGWVQESLTVIWAFVYKVSIGVCVSILLGEVSTPSLRAKTAALATATESVFGIAMNVAVPYMVNPDAANMKGKVGFVFGGLGAMATFVCFVYIPELKRRTFEEIDIMFRNRVPLKKMGQYHVEYTT